MLSREEALNLVKENLKKPNMVKHVLVVEAIMMEIAKHLGENEEEWGLAGILHDIDFEKISDAKEHGVLASEILKGKVDEKIIKTINSHNFENTGVMPETKMDNVLIAADAISGLIIACALILPTKKLNDVKVENLLKRFKEKDFARNCSRENMLFCEKLGLSKEKFFEVSLESLKKISNELGL